MAQSVRDFEKSLECSEDLSAKQYFIVQLDANGKLEVAEGATDFIVGVLQNTPESGQMATYRFLGTSKVKAGGTIAVGDWVTTDASGEAVATTTDGNIVIGRALEAAADGDIFEVQLGIQHLYIA
jgi:hypothetical protein